MIGISHVDIPLVHHCVFSLLIDRHSEVIIHDFWAAGKRPTGKCLRRPNSLNLASALHKTSFYLPTSCFSMDQALLTIFSILEFQTLPQSWISGLFADLLWLRSILPDSIPEHWTTDLTEAIEFWQKGAPGWKALIKRAGRTHLMQRGHDDWRTQMAP